MKCSDCRIQSKSALCPMCATILEVESAARKERLKEEAMEAQFAEQQRRGCPKVKPPAGPFDIIQENLQRQYDLERARREFRDLWVPPPRHPEYSGRPWSEIVRKNEGPRYWL